MVNASVSRSDLMSALLQAAGEAGTHVPLAAMQVDNQPFEALGFDSLIRLEAVCRLERDHKIHIDDGAVSARTPAEMLRIINGPSTPSAASACEPQRPSEAGEDQLERP
ncbi:phosphopantetheine-binding protein [Streptomyces sp. NPDC056480]|uniref:phosphopantetheine-binding protein n=1 Tax=Streptomyces sp. NPDC056480 TaxID=3345833 RepID=UPI0036BA2AB4